MTSTSAAVASFLKNNIEDHTGDKADYNQYWYSDKTIERIVEDLTEQAEDTKVLGFLSTPSLYFSMPDAIRNRSYVFDYDKKWESDRGYVFFDFNSPTDVPSSMHGKFDIIIIDPPFITHDVWLKYAETTKLLLKSDGKICGTTVIENAQLLQAELQLHPTAFMPSIPNLVYQYNLFTNYPSKVFATKNPEIPE